MKKLKKATAILVVVLFVAACLYPIAHAFMQGREHTLFFLKVMGYILIPVAAFFIVGWAVEQFGNNE